MSKNDDMIKLVRLFEGKQFAGEPEQKPGDQVRGTDKAEVKGRQHPFHNRLVGEEISLEDKLSKRYQDMKDVQAREKEQKKKDESEKGVAEGSDKMTDIRIGDIVRAVVDEKRVQGEVIDIFPEYGEVELWLDGVNAFNPVTVDVQDTEVVKKKGVVEGSEDLELYGLRVGDTVKATINGKRVQGDVIDIFPDSMEVELLLRGANAGKTVTVDVRDTESMMEDSALDRRRNKLGADGYISTAADRLRDQELRRQERERNSQRSQAQSDAAADSMINWERNRQQTDDARTKHEIDVLAHRLNRMQRDDDDWERTFDMMRDRINRYQYSTQRDVDPEQLAAISNIQYQPRRKKSDFVPTNESITGAVDAKGRTSQQWLALVNKNYPEAQISQEKGPWGKIYAKLPDGRKLVWAPVKPDFMKKGVAETSPYDFIKPGAMVKFGMWNKPQEHKTGRVVKMADGIVTVNIDGGKTVDLYLANKSLSIAPVRANQQGVAEASGYNGSEPLDLSTNPSVNDVFKRALYIYDYEGYGNDMDYSEDDAIDQYVARKFGQDVLDQLNKARHQSYFGRDDGKGPGGGGRTSNLGTSSAPGGDFRTTKAGKMHSQDAKMMKARVADRLGRHPEPNLPEGMLGNPGEQDSPVTQAITRRILLQRTDLLSKHGPERVAAAIDAVADFVGDVDEIGSSDVSGWIRQVERELDGVVEAAPGLVKAAAGLAVGGIAAAGAPAIVGILGPLLGIPMAAYGAYSAAKLGMKGVEKLWDMAAEKLGGEDQVAQYTNAKIAKLPPDQARAAAQVVKSVTESRRAQGGTELAEVTNPADKITLDVPLMIRIMEYAREDAKDDVDLHNVAEQLVRLSSMGKTLSMADYNGIVGMTTEQKLSELGAVPPQSTANAAPTSGSVSPNEQTALNKIQTNPVMKQQLDKLMTQATPGAANKPMTLDPEQADALEKIKTNAGLKSQYDRLIKQANPTATP